jgi:GT2 family glycosyltransferase
MRISVIVPVHNRKEITLNFLRQFTTISGRLDGVCFCVTVVDDGSTDGTGRAVRESYPNVKVLDGDGNLWWTGAVRKGVDSAVGEGCDSILIMNDDLDLHEDFLGELLALAKREPYALISSIKLRREMNGGARIIAAGFRVVGILKEIENVYAGETYRPELERVLECDLLTGSSLLVPVAVFHEIGNFDSKKFPHHWGDFEFTRRASIAGFRCLVATRSIVYTEYNENYALPYLLESSRADYFRNLFNGKKYYYGFKGTFRASYMHKNVFAGTALFSRGLAGILWSAVLKLALPNAVLRKVKSQSLRFQGGRKTA